MSRRKEWIKEEIRQKLQTKRKSGTLCPIKETMKTKAQTGTGMSFTTKLEIVSCPPPVRK